MAKRDYHPNMKKSNSLRVNQPPTNIDRSEKHTWFNRYFGKDDSKYIKLNSKDSFTLELTQADSHLKQREYSSSAKRLSYALDYVEGCKDISEPKYLQAVHNRIDRLSRKILSEKKADQILTRKVSNLKHRASTLEFKIEHPH